MPLGRVWERRGCGAGANMTSADGRVRAPTWPERGTTDRCGALRSALLAIAFVLASVAAAMDLGARSVEISAVPALISLHLYFATALVVAVSVSVSGSCRASNFEFGSLVAVGMLVVGRLWFGAADPTVRWLTPVVPIGAALLVLEFLRARASNGRVGTAEVLRVADVWCVLAAVGLVAVGIGPDRWGNVALKQVEMGAIGGVTAVLAGVAAAAAARRSSYRAVSYAVASASGLAVAVWVSLVDQGATTLVALAAAGLLVLAAAPTSLIATWVGRPARMVGRTSVASAARARRWVAASATVVMGVIRWPGRATRDLVVRSDEGLVSARPTINGVDRVGALVMATISFVYVVAASTWAHRVGWQPTGHAATVLARAHDVGTVNHPWVGMITSLGESGGASHPGPLVLDGLAPFVRFFGMQNGGILGGAVINLLIWSVATWAGWRAAGRSGGVLAWSMGAVVLEVAALGAVWEANTVSVTMLAMFATVMACWATASGAWRAWWWAVALGSFAAQGYLPHGLVVLGPVVWALVVLVVAATSTDADIARSARRAVAGGLMIGAVAWSQPLIDALLNAGGNVRALMDQVLNPQPPVGVRGIPLAISWATAVPPRWSDVTGSFALAGTAEDFLDGGLIAGWGVAILLVVLCCATWRVATRSERQLRIVVGAMLLGAMLDVSQLPQDRLHSFQLGWLVVVSLTVWFAVIVGVAAAVRRVVAGKSGAWVQWTRAAAYGLAAVVVVAAGLSGPSTIQDVKGSEFTIDAMVGPLSDQTLDHLNVDGPVLVLGLDQRLNQVNTDTVLSNLIVGGLDVRVEPHNKHYGPHRIVRGGWTGPMLWVTSGLDPVQPDGRRLAVASNPGWTRSEFDALARSVSRALVGARRIELDSWVEDRLPRYLAGWVADPCRVAAGIRDGSYPISSLPPGLLLVLVGDGAIITPQLSSTTRARAQALVGQAPIEVWQVDGRLEGPIDSDELLRDGGLCRTA